MFGDYLRGFWRGVLRNKVATLINVGGLAIGFSVFFALSFYVYREFSWDAHWDDADRIYVASAMVESAAGNAPMLMNIAPYVLGTSLQSRHPEYFDTYARIYSAQGTVVVDNGSDEYPFMGRSHVEPAMLELLQFETVEGSLDEIFADPRSVAISAATAERMFGTASPLEHLVSFKAQQGFGNTSGNADFVIKAVFRLPDPTTFTMQFLAGLEPGALPDPNARLDLWDFVPAAQPPQPGQASAAPQVPFRVAHYFKLNEGMDPAMLENELRNFMDENRFMDSGVNKTRFVFRNIQDLHLEPSPFQSGDNVQRLWVYAAIGVLVLLISGCNFVMLATLRLVDRMREVGIRKSAGARGVQLMWQHLFDAFFHVVFAAALAVLFLALAFPKLAVMLEFPLQVNLVTPRNLALCLLMVVLFTLASSLYPAWLCSQSKPGPLLRNGAGAVVGTGTGLRKLLVGVQFAIVVVLLLATGVVRQQIDYTRNRDLGYSMEDVVSVRTNDPGTFARIPALLAEFKTVPGVEAAAVGGVQPGAIVIAAPTQVRTRAADGSVREAGLSMSSASANYFRVMSIRVLAGREFSEELDTLPAPAGGAPSAGTSTNANVAPNPERKVIVNAAAARQLGFADPAAAIDQLLESETTTPDRQVRKQSMRVVGVVADTQLVSAMLPPTPTLYNYAQSSNFFVVKLLPEVDPATVTEGLRAAWDRVLPGTQFTTQDHAAALAFVLAREEFEARIVTVSTLLAIVIALFGLYGLVAATVVKRVKEIGVRKVMGAERGSIVTLFLLQFSKPIVVANLVAWPFGFWAIRQWLTRFPYQLDTFVIVMSGVVASLVALLIAWLTVGTMAARAASVNPVKALRYE